MCAHAAEYPQAVAYEHSGLYTQQFFHHHQQQQLEQLEQQQQYHLYPQNYQNHQQQQPQQELQEQHQQYHHYHQQQYDDHQQQQQQQLLQQQQQLLQQQQQQQQQQAPSYYQAPVYWEPLPPVAPVIPPLNPIPVPSLDAESRKRSREDIGAEEENAKRLATTPEILFRLLVSANRVGKLIGKQGMHIKQLRDETGARIRIADAQSPVEERVVLISSKDEPDELKCAAEHALIRAATLIIEPETGEKGVVATIGPQHNVGPNLTRLLISGSQAGCIIGKAGATIQEIRGSAAGATVRILPREQLPLCSSASESDRLMQISGEMPQVQRALELVAAKLRENPPRETSSTTLPMIQQHDGVGYVVTMPIIPKVTAEMTVPSSLIGGVIGRGGANITQIRQLSGATVKVRGQKDGSSHRIIYFEGSSEQVSVAQSLVEALLTQQ